jgi:hypothetical protein
MRINLRQWVIYHEKGQGKLFTKKVVFYSAEITGMNPREIAGP